MRELRPQREPPAVWPQALLLAVVLVVVGALLWAMLAPAAAGAERLDPLTGGLVVAGIVLAAAVGTWVLSVAPRRLDYRLRGRTLVVTTLFGRRVVPLSSVTAVERTAFELTTMPGAHASFLNSHMPGYYVGLFPLSGLKRTRVAVGVRKGRGVILHLASGEALLLAPRDPEALAALVEERGGRR